MTDPIIPNLPLLELQATVFRELLANQRSARELASWSALWGATQMPYDPATDDSTLARTGTGDESPTHLGDFSSPATPDAAALLIASQPLNGATAAAQTAAAVADPGPSIAELIERHVRRTLAARSTGAGSTEEVHLELTDAVLPETQLSLKRGPSGWQLLAVTGRRSSLERLEEFAPQLIKRFAHACLGCLEVVTRLAQT